MKTRRRTPTMSDPAPLYDTPGGNVLTIHDLTPEQREKTETVFSHICLRWRWKGPS